MTAPLLRPHGRPAGREPRGRAGAVIIPRCTCNSAAALSPLSPLLPLPQTIVPASHIYHLSPSPRPSSPLSSSPRPSFPCSSSLIYLLYLLPSYSTATMQLYPRSIRNHILNTNDAPPSSSSVVSTVDSFENAARVKALTSVNMGEGRMTVSSNMSTFICI